MVCNRTEWFLKTVLVTLGALLIVASGCKQKESPVPESAVPDTAEDTSQSDAVLEKMRQQATMPAGGDATARPPVAAPAPAAQGNPLFPKELFEAAKNGDLETVQGMMNSGRPVLVIDENGSSPVHYAAAGGQIKMLEYLLTKSGFTANDVNRQKVTALHWAAVSGQRNAVGFLVSRGARIEARDEQGRTPLFAAAANGRVDVVDYLIQKGANINAPDRNGQTPLSTVMARSRSPEMPPEVVERLTEVVKMLTDHGAKATMPTATPAAASKPGP